MLKQATNKNWKWFVLGLALILSVITIFNVIKMQEILFNNAQIMGQEISRRLSVEAENNFARFFNLLDYMEIEMRKEYRGENNLEIWMREYKEELEENSMLNTVDIYAVIDGVTIGVDIPSNELPDPNTRVWYQMALDARGHTVMTNKYIDYRLKIPVITIAKKILGTEDVIAIDLYFNEKTSVLDSSNLPEGSNYYMCDSQGQLIYSMLSVDSSLSTVQEKFEEVFKEIQLGKHDSPNSYIYGLDSQKRAVYYYKMENDWYSVITIPYTILLESTNEIWLPFLGILIIFICSLFVYAWFTIQDRKKLYLYNSTLAVLGNSYYGLYQVDLNTGQYEMLKANDSIRNKIPVKGNYQLFLQAWEYNIEPEVYGDFIKAFSIENMKNLTLQRVRNFGGDFKRIFNGKMTWTHIHMLYDESLQDGKVVLCFQDVNDSKEKELERIDLLQNSLDTLNHISQSKNRFFSHMSHDMRTPLNAIIGLSNLALQQQDIPDKTQDSLKKILSSSQQLLGLINDILEMSKMEQHGVKFNEQPFDLRANLKELCEIFEIQAFNDEKNFLSEFHLSHGNVSGDWKRIQQILNNVISNAFKYSPTYSTISFSVNEFKHSNSKYGKYQFIVKDNGSGMSEDFLKKLFEPFQREMRFGGQKASGTGLGMAITKELVTRMDGQIEVESKLDKGTTITITLPLEAVDTAPQPAELAEEKEQKAISQQQSNEYKVLLAEDNEINMEIATELLKMHQFDVVQAWNGKEALELFANSKEQDFDLILLDMQMPLMDGCEAAKAIRALSRKDAKTVPIIAVTANAFSEDITQTQRAGMNAHISKPIDFAVFEKTVKKFLNS